MKSVLIISAVTFVLIFGGVAMLVLQLGHGSAAGEAAVGGVADAEASARVLRDLQLERDRLQREREQLASRRASFAVQEQVLAQACAKMQEMVGKLETGRQAQSTRREEAAVKLAKMYETMSPQKAAPILASLEPDITLDIMRRMKERQAAAVLACMDAGIAAQISTRLSLKED